MGQKSEFRTVEFFRQVRDEQAAILAGKDHKDIIAFFSLYTARKPDKALHKTGPKAARR